MTEIKGQVFLDGIQDNERILFSTQKHSELSELEEKEVNKIISRNEKRLKPKTLKINVNEAVLEGNLIEMPFITYSKTNKKELVSLCEYTWIDSKNAKRGIEIRGSAKFGVPTSFDFDVLVALLRVFVRNNEIKYSKGIFNQNLGKDITIDFTFTEIAKELGYKRPNIRILDRIQNSLQTLTDTTIYNKFSGGIYDITKEDYVDDESIGFHIIELFKSYGYKSDKKGKRLAPKDITQTVVLNKFFYKSMTNSYFKLFDYYKYNQLQSGIAKKIYLLINKWTGKGDGSKKIKLSTLYDRIPLDPEVAVRVKNQSIKKALENLKNINFIEDYEFLRKEKAVMFYFNNDTSVPLVEEKVKPKNEYSTFSLFKNRMLELGFSHEFIDEHMDYIVENFKDVKAFVIELEEKKLSDGEVKDALEKRINN